MSHAYSPPWWLKNGHVQSIYPSLFRRVVTNDIRRERVTTSDDDFLDLDWHEGGFNRLVVISHGLEGNSRRPYVLGMAKAVLGEGWDALAWNFRSCSGEPNRRLTSYHSGQIQDLADVVDHAIAQDRYKEIVLIGFSIGGNKTLRYLATQAKRCTQVKGGVAFSVPVDLESSAHHLATPSKYIYMKNFLVSFKEKLALKQSLYPDEVDLVGFDKIRTFVEFDERYTAPMNGFGSALEYWRESSSLPMLPDIDVPTLMLSALDDPFLPEDCYPVEQVNRNPKLRLELPRYGGHVGFMPQSRAEPYWSELRATTFLRQLL